MNSKAKAFLAIVSLALAVGVLAAQKKPWTEWTAKDAEKILNDSGWGQMQIETEISEMNFSPQPRDVGSVGAINQATAVNIYIRFLSAKPIRLAYLRLLELSKASAAEVDRMREFANTKYDKTIVISVECSGKDNRFVMPFFQALTSGITSTLKNDTYLDVKGRREFLQEYQPPVPGQGLGAKFIFSRYVDDKPLIDAKTSDVRFYAEFPRLSGNNPQLKIDRRFKVKDFMYEGVIEY